MCDTWPKIKRKMWLEKEIEQLEKDIRLVESHPYIYLDSSNSTSLQKIKCNIRKGFQEKIASAGSSSQSKN